MSDAVMWKPSSYSDSIKFYERMSQLQGELKTYESQHFNLEEEFQRLWTQDTSVPVSASGVEPKTTTRVQLGHLSEKSQLLANPTNTNPRNYEDQDPRRARNASILDKLQELETNASIFAARSERLRMMRVSVRTCTSVYSTDVLVSPTAFSIHIMPTPFNTRIYIRLSLAGFMSMYDRVYACV